MADTQVTPDTLPETVSRDAHQRMTDDRNEWKAKAEKLTGFVTDLSLTDKARKHFAEKKVDDPDWAAEIALPSIKTSNTEIGDVGTYLDDKFARLYPTAQPDTEVPSADDGVPTPDAVEPPGFARPSPASEGAPPDGLQKYTISDPHIQALIEANNVAEIERLHKAGQYVSLSEAPGQQRG